jgi:hypothetical protein
VVRVGIDFRREHPIEQPRQMGPDEFEFTGEELIVG